MAGKAIASTIQRRKRLVKKIHMVRVPFFQPANPDLPEASTQRFVAGLVNI
jgi:hypothetical protein